MLVSSHRRSNAKKDQENGRGPLKEKRVLRGRIADSLGEHASQDAHEQERRHGRTQADGMSWKGDTHN